MSQRVIKTRYDLDWLPKPNEVRSILDTKLPPIDLVTSASVLAFQGDRLLLTNLVDRGWDIPGGRLEPGEGPEDRSTERYTRRPALESTTSASSDMSWSG